MPPPRQQNGRMLQVGAATAEIEVRVGEPLAGYALRQGPCTGSHDPLRARVVVLHDGTASIAIAALDLLYVPAALDAAVRTAVAEAAEVEPGAVLVSATHTHAGPANLATDPRLQQRIATAARSAARNARATCTAATLALATRRVTGIGGNRRAPDGPADDTARIIVTRTADGSRTIATIVGFACHATVLDQTCTESSADFPGAMCRQLERRVGGTALYLQGAAGDLNPTVTGPTHDECERIGGILAAAATGAVLQVAGLQGGLRTTSPSHQTAFLASGFPDCRIMSETGVASSWAEATAAPARDLPPAEQIARARRAIDGPPGAEDARLWIRQLRAEQANLFGVFDEPAPTRIRLQRLDIGPDLTLLAIPGEPFGDTAAALRAATDRQLIVVGYAHQSIGYLPPPQEWAHGGYEVGCCLYTDTVEPQIRSAAGALLREPRGGTLSRRP